MKGHATRNDIVDDGFFNVANIASARASLTISLRVAGPEDRSRSYWITSGTTCRRENCQGKSSKTGVTGQK